MAVLVTAPVRVNAIVGFIVLDSRICRGRGFSRGLG